jgi:hypothetical protein
MILSIGLSRVMRFSVNSDSLVKTHMYSYFDFDISYLLCNKTITVFIGQYE